VPAWTVHPRDSFRALTSGAYFLMYNRPPSLPTPSKPPHHTCIRHSHTSDHAQPPSTTFHHHHAIYITLSSPLISFLRLPIRTTWGGAQPHPPFLRIDLSFVVQLLAPILASLHPRSHREIPIFSHHSHSSSAHSPMTQPAHVHTFVPRTPDLAWFAAQLRHISRAPSSRYPTPLALFLSCPYMTVSRHG
jgi:hypothetical protein